MVGHNPGLSDLLAELTGRYENLTTANIAYLRLPIQHWADVDEALRGQLVQIWRPREL
jgi:phosphohistidine phosphatase SixA